MIESRLRMIRRAIEEYEKSNNGTPDLEMLIEFIETQIALIKQGK